MKRYTLDVDEVAHLFGVVSALDGDHVYGTVRVIRHRFGRPETPP